MLLLIVTQTAASTKDNMLLIETPNDPTTPGESTQLTFLMYSVTLIATAEKIKMHLKDVGTDLVANLSLFTQFSRSVNGIAEWWDWIKNDLASESPTVLPPSSGSDLEAQESGDLYALWTTLKENLQEYHNIVHIFFQFLLVSDLI